VSTSQQTDARYRFETLVVETIDGVCTVTMNRPAKLNAMSLEMRTELAGCFDAIGADRSIRVVVLTGAGRAFSGGGDINDFTTSAQELHALMGRVSHRWFRSFWALPQPVIAAVNGIAVGGGHVLHVLCDLSIASETARFGQAGPKVGSFDAGFGSAYLARVVGEKRAREIWYLCRLYDAQTAERWGLVNKVVPADQLLAEAKAWAAEIAEKSPTAIRFLKQSFNADTDHQAGLSNLAMSALDLFTASPEGLEGAAAFAEKRRPDFASHVVGH